jgi:hypothetical protein
MDFGDTMFVAAVIAAMAIFAVTLFSAAWMTNRRR